MFIYHGICVLHHCDNPSCVNPKHLFLGTAKDNNSDRAKKGRSSVNIFQGEDSGVSKLTECQVLEIRRLWDTGEYYKYEIAEMFPVSAKQIGSIVNRQSWKHL